MVRRRIMAVINRVIPVIRADVADKAELAERRAEREAVLAGDPVASEAVEAVVDEAAEVAAVAVAATAVRTRARATTFNCRLRSRIC